LEGIAQAETVLNKTYWAIILLLGLVSVLIVAIVFMLSRTLRGALAGIQQQLIPLRQGDLTQRLPENTKDELGEIASGVNAFVDELQSIVHRTRDRSNQLAESAQQLAAASATLLQSSTHQSDATSIVAASVEEFSASVDHVASNATQAQQKASTSGSLADSGRTEVLSVVEEIRRIEKIVSEAVAQMEGLGQQTKGISRIVNVIKEVADQTNLLALNAAIEAARAGESGRGFAVVADEVRKLAERTSVSTHEITAMISAIQQNTETMTGMMQKGNELVAHGVIQIEQAGNSMQQITDSSTEVVGAISEISTLLSEQRIAGAEIAKNVERIAKMTEQGRNTAAEVSSAAQQLELLADELQKQVETFKV
jgi:methyl-accepting chemotaxis protein